MSRENLATVRRIYSAARIAGGRPADPEGVAAVIEVLDPDAELLPGIVRVTGASYRGRAGLREWIDDMREAWEYFRPEPISFTDAGDHVVVDVRAYGRGRTSAAEVERQTTQVWTFRQGKVVRFETFTDRKRALEAAGLPE